MPPTPARVVDQTPTAGLDADPTATIVAEGHTGHRRGKLRGYVRWHSHVDGQPAVVRWHRRSRHATVAHGGWLGPDGPGCRTDYVVALDPTSPGFTRTRGRLVALVAPPPVRPPLWRRIIAALL